MTRRSWPVRVYVRLLRLLPRAFRERHGPEMAHVFEEMWRERRGPGGRFRVAMGAVWDVVRRAW
ncbi:MAG: hypothetical protein PVJ02_07435, partial [Gemmatimonadota bacterium]